MTPPKLLTQNSELRKIGVYNWTLPAWAVRLPDGRTVNVCPSAGICRRFCYARSGTYLFSNVRAAHMRNLMMIMDDLPGWEEAMNTELSTRRFNPKGVIREVPGIDPFALDETLRDWMLSGAPAVRIHDSGDFFTDEYLQAWLRIAEKNASILFYAYTKEVSRFRRVLGRQSVPANFRYLYSLGGKEDDLIDRDTDRHADVWPDEVTMAEAGYSSQDASDLLCVLVDNVRVGVPANNIPHFNKKLAGRTFAQFQSEQPGKV